MKFATTFTFLLCALLSFSQAPTADFSASPIEVCIGDQINFTDLSTAGGAPISGWVWDLAMETHPQHRIHLIYMERLAPTR